jgi:hypothetical protein
LQPSSASACETSCDTDDWLQARRFAAADMLPVAATATTASKLLTDNAKSVCKLGFGGVFDDDIEGFHCISIKKNYTLIGTA